MDIIVTTALIPGKPAPRLITKEMVQGMKSGSVIVDLAAQTGGNCELTVADRVTVTENGVKIIGYTDLPSRLPTQSSQLYGTNLVNLLKLLCKEKNGEIDVDFEDNVIRGVTVVKMAKSPGPRHRFRFPPSRNRRNPPRPLSRLRKSRLRHGRNTRSWLLRSCCLAGWRTWRRKSFCRISPYSPWHAWWDTTWCGMSVMRCIRR